MSQLKSEEIKKQISTLVDEYYECIHKPSPFNPETDSIPASGKVFDQKDMNALIEASLDFWLTTGRFNDSFEKELAKFIGVRKALSVNSGSSANLLAFATLCSPQLKERAIKPGDEVITCATAFPTTINPIILYGAVPVFLDVNLDSYNMDISHLEQALSPKTKAIVLAHTLGNPFDLETIKAFADKHKLWLIEDCCDALGAHYQEKHVGTFGDIGTLSFYPAHHITTGEGGAVFSQNPLLLKIMESIRDWGRDCWCPPGKDNTCGKRFDWQLGQLPLNYDHKYTYSNLGFNLKMTDMQAAVGTTQLKKLPQFIEQRRRNFAYLNNKFQSLEDIFILPKASPHSDPSWFGFPLTIRKDAPFSRDALLRHLNETRVGTRLLFASNVTRQPYMSHYQYRCAQELKNSDIVTDQTFWVGLYPGLNQEHLDYLFESLDAFISR